MRILITGANGFIAREIIARLSTSGHEIIACAHNKLFDNIPRTHAFKTDFTKATTEAYWLPHVQNIDVVINCVGVFQTSTLKTMWAIHYEAPKALFAACVTQGVKKIIQLSALGIDKVDVPYAASKLAADTHLQSLTIDSTIIRPSLVYGKGSYGGTSLFRGLAAMPWVILLPGSGQQLQQPIHIDDLTHIIENSLNLPGQHILCAVGLEKLSIKNVLEQLRCWLGFKKALVIAIPNSLIKLGAKLGNFLPNSPLSETGVKMMAFDNTATEQEVDTLVTLSQVKPRSFRQGLNGMVSSVQDRWHARLYFLRPLLRLSIAFIWFYSGIVSILPSVLPLSFQLLIASHIPLVLQPSVLYGFSTLDILLALATFLNYRIVLMGAIQCLVILFYSLSSVVFLSAYWLHPFAPMAKNIPLMVAILIMMALASDR